MAKAGRAHSRVAEVLCVILFVCVMAGANLLIANFGPWLLPVTAFFCVGMTLITRDYLHDVWRDRPGALWPRLLGMIAAAAVLSFIVDNSALSIALGSVAALTSSALVETGAFALLVRRPWLVRSNGAALFGAITDSVVFPLVAFGVGGVDGFLALVAAQTATKLFGGVFWSLVFRFTINPDKQRAARQARREAALQM